MELMCNSLVRLFGCSLESTRYSVELGCMRSNNGSNNKDIEETFLSVVVPIMRPAPLTRIHYYRRKNLSLCEKNAQ